MYSPYCPVSYYSIKDLETLSGIKAHTLRIWEQRYNILQPKRTDTNIRFYDDSDLKLILNISLLNQNGYKISRIATFSQEEMQSLVLKLTEENLKYPEQVQALTMCMMEIDEVRFEKLISRSILQFGLEKTMVHIVYPFLHKVGLLWQIGSINPYQEHFISNLLRQKLIVAIDAQVSTTDADAKKYLLFLPEGELHEIGLLFSSYIIKSRGGKVYYFGQSLPFNDLKEACTICSPDYIFTVLTSVSVEDSQNIVDKLSEYFPSITSLITGYQVINNHLLDRKNIIYLKNALDFIDFIDKKNR